MFQYISKNLIRILLFSAMLYGSCKKEPIEPPPGNAKPVANAGDDLVVHLPDERQVHLDGSRSYDPDGSIRFMKYTWTQLSGPKIFQLLSDVGSTIIQEPGVYSFELKVEDAQSLVDRDTVVVTAVLDLVCNPEFAKLSSTYEQGLTIEVARDACIAAIEGGLVIAGGRTYQDIGWGGGDVYASKFTIIYAGRKIVLEDGLSSGRARMGIVQAGSEIYFAGGISSAGITDVIDIFDLNRKTLRNEKLSVSRSSIAAVASGDLVFFAGGRALNNEASDVVDIYDINTKSFTTARLSIPRTDLTAIASGSKLFFAGGEDVYGSPSSRVDIYDLNSGQWSVAELPTPRSGISAARIGDEVAFYGGTDQKRRRVDQISYININSLVQRTECIVGNDPSHGFFVQNVNTTISGQTTYFLGIGMISRKHAGQNWEIGFIPYGSETVGIFSEANEIYALVHEPDAAFSGLTTDVELRKIRFQ